MADISVTIGASLALLFLIFVALLMLGANFAPDWAKSRGFLVAVGALVIIGTTTLQ